LKSFEVEGALSFFFFFFFGKAGAPVGPRSWALEGRHESGRLQSTALQDRADQLRLPLESWNPQ